MTSSANKTELIESKSIDYVPENERHGKPRDLFTLWFCTNIAPLAIFVGATSTQVYNLNIISAIIAIICGHLFGGLFLALTSAQGPQVGIPQMVQSRAQFGRYGSLLVIIFTAVIYLGFFISNIILSGKALHIVAPKIEIHFATIIGAISATFIGVVGYNFIHKINKIGSWVMGGALLSGFIYMLSQPLPSDFWYKGSFSLVGWFAVFSISAVWQISFSPYTSDYSRYLPKDVGIAKPFWYTYFGACGGTILAFLFGVFAVNSAPHVQESMEAVKLVTGFLGPILMILFLINIICHNAMNLYGAVLSIITAIQTFIPHWKTSTSVRVIYSTIVLLGATLIALASSASFVSFFLNMIFALSSVLIPWAIINLLDFYLIKKKIYNINAIFDEKGGVYGLFNVNSLSVYFIGILVQIPFIKNAFFIGPYAELIPGVDLSWLISLVCTSLLYSLFHNKKHTMSQLEVYNQKY
ncbi:MULTISPECIES: purine-cytosine permease family protein [unclassified Providencia]|uniref:purine-cytosine permease family protein n=1 Tax=unclassified Providencia TaxID=2633465 RepID=UPI00234AEF58|nr:MULTISPECIES: cytosine permease [unclassified Providencia]